MIKCDLYLFLILYILLNNRHSFVESGRPTLSHTRNSGRNRGKIYDYYNTYSPSNKIKTKLKKTYEPGPKFYHSSYPVIGKPTIYSSNFISLNINDRKTTNEIEYNYNPINDADIFEVLRPNLLKKITEDERLLWQSNHGKYCDKIVAFKDKNGENRLKVYIYDDPNSKYIPKLSPPVRVPGVPSTTVEKTESSKDKEEKTKDAEEKEKEDEKPKDKEDDKTKDKDDDDKQKEKEEKAKEKNELTKSKEPKYIPLRDQTLIIPKRRDDRRYLERDDYRYHGRDRRDYRYRDDYRDEYRYETSRRHHYRDEDDYRYKLPKRYDHRDLDDYRYNLPRRRDYKHIDDYDNLPQRREYRDADYRYHERDRRDYRYRDDYRDDSHRRQDHRYRDDYDDESGYDDWYEPFKKHHKIKSYTPEDLYLLFESENPNEKKFNLLRNGMTERYEFRPDSRCVRVKVGDQTLWNYKQKIDYPTALEYDKEKGELTLEFPEESNFFINADGHWYYRV